MGKIVDQVLAHPATGSLFARVAVACPGDPPLRLPPPEPADLAAWQPPAPPTVASDDFRQIARTRAGFFITSYTGVKRHHGGFVAAEEPAEIITAEAPGETVEPASVDPHELERGRQSGIFLHAILEHVPLDAAAEPGSPTGWAEQPAVAKWLQRLARRHERDPRQIAHAARLVHAALSSPLRLGDALVPGLGRQRPSLRETEFLYPIPEQQHPLLGSTGANDGRPWSVERGLVKGFIDYLFEYQGRVYLCDWKGDWLPSWDKARLVAHCQNNYEVQARLYTLAVLRMAGLHERSAFEARFGGVLYCFLRGLRPDDPEAGIYFHKPDWQAVLAWQSDMLADSFWGLA
jgi:exodeoxyribonuclease V beta subunit